MLTGEELLKPKTTGDIIQLIEKNQLNKYDLWMLVIKCKNVRIDGIVSCIPNNLVRNNDFSNTYTDKEIEQVCKSIGVNERYHVSKNTKTSDLCLQAANHLIESLNWERSSIDGVILLTQTPDRLLPASATRIQNLLGLK